jgi:hypothetical protein
MSSVYGNPIPAFIATLTGFANGDTASSAVTGVARFSTPATDTSNVGAYAITPEIGTLAAANYSFQFKVGTLTITRAVLTITATDQSIEHGSPLPVLTYTLSGFAAGESLSGALTGTPSLSTTAKSSSPVGTYAINVGAGTLAATNYSFKFVNATLTITAAETN